jgi:hypothetical protein
MKTLQRKQTLFKMFQVDLLSDNDIKKTVKFGFALYIAMALLATPVAICSHQHQMPELHYSLPDLQRDGLVTNLKPQAVSSLLEAAEPPVELQESAPVQQKPAPPFHSQIIKASQTYNVEVALIKAVIMAESSYNPKAVSHRGAQGLMQLMPTTAKWLGVHDSFDPELNIDGGVRYLRRLLDRFDGDVRLALAAYNAGSRYVRKYGGVPPFKATHKYINKVLKYRKTYLKELAAAQMQQIAS